MIIYNININNGNEYLNVDTQTITLQENLTPVGNSDIARQINHLNPLIPEALGAFMVECTLKGILELMALGHVV